MAVQIEAEDLRITSRLAMAGVDTQEIEGDIDRIRSLGLEELRREWRRLPTALTGADVEFKTSISLNPIMNVRLVHQVANMIATATAITAVGG